MIDYNYDWVNEWNKEKLSKKIIDTLDFIWCCIKLGWHVVFVFGIAMVLFWMFINSVDPNVGFVSGNLIYLLLGASIPLIYSLGVRKGVRY